MNTKKLTDAEAVQAYMDLLEHPLKEVIEALRSIIKSASPLISERIKWNAPSYYYREDMLTFGPPSRREEEILLVFHYPGVVKMDSPMLHGDYKDRRLATFKSMEEVESGREELIRILKALMLQMEASE